MFVLSSVGTDGSLFQSNAMTTIQFQEMVAQIVLKTLATLAQQHEEVLDLVIQSVMIQ